MENNRPLTAQEVEFMFAVKENNNRCPICDNSMYIKFDSGDKACARCGWDESKEY